MPTSAPKASDDTAARGGAKIVRELDGCVMALMHDISIVVWATQATKELALEFEKMADQVARSHARTSTVHIIERDIPLPTPEARAKFNELTTRFSQRLIGAATVLMGEGFAASAMRGFLTGLHLLERGRPYKARIFSSSHDAAQWLAPFHASLSVTIDPRQLEAQLVSLRGRPSIQSFKRPGG